MLRLQSLMGSSSPMKNITNLMQESTQFQRTQNTYYQHIFLNHKKTSAKFREELTSICKRSSYLHYEWAQLLLKFFKQTSQDKLYGDYKSVLKQNCKREGTKQKIFCPSEIRNCFMASIIKKSQKLGQSVSLEQLQGIVQQVKTYFMVMAWLHKLVTLQSNLRRKQESQQLLIYQQDRIFSLVVDLAERFFKSNFHRQNSISLQFMFNQNGQMLWLAKKLQRNLSFRQKQEVIALMLQLLQNDKEKLLDNASKIMDIIGPSICFAHLFTVRQLGTIDVSPLEGYFSLITKKTLPEK